MGMTRSTPFPAGAGWDQLADAAKSAGFEPVVKMLDGLPAFPGEVPEPGWREVRVSLGDGMVTLRREGEVLHFVMWGNADAGLTAAVERWAEELGRT